MVQGADSLAECGLEASSGWLWLTERGTSFGYNSPLVDNRNLPQLQALAWPVIFEATHPVQQSCVRGTTSAVQREFVASVARAADAVAVDGVFMEVHTNLGQALSDRLNMLLLQRLQALLHQLLAISLPPGGQGGGERAVRGS